MSRIKEIISDRHSVTGVYYRREFQLIGGEKGDGFSFPCNEEGTPDTTDQHYESWKSNYQYCLSHPEIYADKGCVEWKHTYMEPVLARCSCGAEIRLNGDTQCPSCGQWYNAFGQALLPPEHWNDFDEYYEDN